MAAILPGIVDAGPSFRVRPQLLLSETYLDNVTLGSSSQIQGSSGRLSSAVTSFMPGVSVMRNGVWKVALNYQMQGLIYAGGYNGTNIFNMFQFNANGPVIKDAVDLSIWSSSSQANFGLAGNGNTTGGIYAMNNLARIGNIGNFTTVRITPTWKPHFGGYASGVIGAFYSHTDGGNNNQQSSLNGDIVSEFANLYSGKQFDLVGWRANFFHSSYLTPLTTISASGAPIPGSSPEFLNYNGQVQYRFSEKIQPFVQAGSFQNEFGSNSSTAVNNYGGLEGARNGSYWNAGIIWTPSRRLYAQAGAGLNNYFVSFRSTPSNRTEVEVTFRDSRVGGGIGYGAFGGNNAGMNSMPGGSLGGGIGGVFGGNAAGGGMGVGSGIDSGGTSIPGTSSAGGGIYKAGMKGACQANMGMGGSNIAGMGLMGGMGRSSIGGMGFGGSGVANLNANFAGVSSGVGQLGGFNAGRTVSANVCQNWRKTTLRVGYNEFITTPQYLLGQQTVFDQSSVGAIASNQAYGVPYYLPVLNGNEAMAMRGGVGSLQHNYSKNSLFLSLYQQNRSYQYSGTQDVWGLQGMWYTRLTRKASMNLSYFWQNQQNNFTGIPSYTSQLNSVQIAFYHTLWQNMTAALSYQYITQNSANNSNAVYDQNAITASFFMIF